MMDAKPQRLTRALRVHNDENYPSEGPLPKTIHHRNKSSPALNVSVAALKGGAKRNAFGDVSNIVNAKRRSQDDAAVPAKNTSQHFTKLGQLVRERKSSALLGAHAQRPNSVSGLKALLTNNNSNSVDTAPRPSVDAITSQQSAFPRKTLNKKGTIVFKDAVLEPVQEDSVPSTTQQDDSTASEAVPQAPSLPEISVLPLDTHLQLEAPEPSLMAEPVKSPQTHRLIETSLPMVEEVKLATNDTSNETVDTNQVNHIDDVNIIHVEPVASPDVSQPEYVDARTSLIEPSIVPQSHTIDMHAPAADFDHPISQAQQPLCGPPTSIPVRGEPEEYWEEEEEEEDDAYDEEGYVTARSFRSRGDNTTGGATTVLFPKMNQRVHREIAASKILVEAMRTPEDIEDEHYDTSMVAEYGEEIFEYMRQMEVKMMPNAHYMENQHEIQWSMRNVLMDWLVQVHHRFNLLPETLFLCVNYIDRFLSCKVVSLGKLQLVGATAIFIAAKYEEINCPSIGEIVYMVDGGYSVDEILKAERFMLTMLQFELGWPGPMSFLRRISKADDYDLETRTLAKYFLEVTIMDERFIGSPPSFTAAASHCLARLMLRKGHWTPHHVFYSGYTYSQLRPIVQLLVDCCDNARQHHEAVYKKYCDKRFKRASAFVETELRRGFHLPEVPIIRTVQHTNWQTYYPMGTTYA